MKAAAAASPEASLELGDRCHFPPPLWQPHTWACPRAHLLQGPSASGQTVAVATALEGVTYHRKLSLFSHCLLPSPYKLPKDQSSFPSASVDGTTTLHW